MKTLLSVVILTFLTVSTLLAQKNSVLWNEENTLAFQLSIKEGKLEYSILAKDTTGKITLVIQPSRLGITRSDTAFLADLTLIETSEVRSIDDPYTLVTGKRLEIQNRAREQSWDFKNPEGKRLRITARAMQDSVAFQYAFPEKSKELLKVTDEITSFHLSDKNGKAWMLPYDNVSQWAPSYESAWENEIPIGKTVEADFPGWSLPALFQTQGYWLLITEAGIDKSHFGVHLQPDAPNGEYCVRLPEEPETYGVAPQEATISLPWSSPWRVVVVGETPATILETNVVTDLSAPSKLQDTSWIKPGRVSWSWWSDKGSPYDYNRLVPFVDLSADMGWEYALVDLGWEFMINGNAEQLIEYANSKSVDIILWYNSGGDHNQLYGGVRDKLVDPKIRQAEMAKLQKWGVKGIKVDFMQSDKQYLMQLYIDILEDAAKYKLFVDFHGSTIPRGWARTYPNLLTQEAVRGAEQYWDPNFAANAHTFHTIYTYTRNVIGSMDYTPVIFGGAPELERNQTTNAHELALSVAFESGLQHFVDSVSAYRSQPDFVQAFLKAVPVVWDETRYLEGEPGKLTLLARRKEKEWFVACINGEDLSKTITVDFSFLPAANYEATLISDGEVRNKFSTQQLEIDADSTLEVSVLGKGGFVVSLKQL